MAKSLFFIMITLTSFLSAQQVEFLHEQVMDMGKVSKGDVITGEIVFKNSGSTPLELESIKPSCGCTAVTPKKMTYAPGETANIPYTLDTKNFSGVIRKNIRINFKNADTKTHIVVVQAKIVTDLNISPRFINFQKVKLNPDTTYTEFFEIENESGGEIQINKIRSSNAHVSIFPESVTIPSGKSHLIRIELKPQETGRQNGQILIESDHKNQNELSIPVFINVRS
ncbi:MAG: DUF1573 domain-containing protein [Calditrichia bacterium]